MKKIVHFIRDLSSGGAETMVKDYVIELKKRGYDVKVMVLYSDPTFPNEQLIRENEIPIHTILPQRPTTKALISRIVGKVIRGVKIRQNIRNYLKKEKPDILHVHLPIMRYLIGAYAGVKDTKIFYTCHNETSVNFRTDNMDDWLDKCAVRFFLKRRNSRIIALHSRMKHEIDDIFHVDTTSVLNNPINVHRFAKPEVDRDKLKHELGIPTESFVIGHVGRFSEQKNHKFLIKVFCSVVEKEKNAFLLMVGAGPLKESVCSELDRMGLSGRYLVLSNRRDIPQLNALMDVFCFPSLYEGLGIVLLEAQASGLKCVISDSIPKEVIASDRVVVCGLDETPEQWRDAILSPKPDYEKPRCSLRDFDLVNVVDELEKIYMN